MNFASAFVECADLKLRRPRAALQPYLGCFWSLTTTSATRLRALPDACATLITDGVNNNDFKCLLIGPRVSAAESAPGPGHRLAGVRLEPGVAYVLTRHPMDTLVDQRAPVSTILGPGGSRLERLLRGNSDADKRIDLLEEFLMGRLGGAKIDGRVQKALERIEQLNGQVRVTQVSEHCKLSARQLNRLSRTWVGLSTKRLIMIARFQALLRQVESSAPAGWAALAAATGYYDQPHLSNEVTEFAGVTPQLLSALVADFSKTRCS